MAFQSLRDILPQTLDGLGIAERVSRERAMRLWPAVAQEIDPALARGSRAIALQGAALLVRVSEPALVHLIACRREQVVALLNARLGAGQPSIIQDVRVQL